MDLVVANIDDVESFFGVTDDVLDRICRILCKRRLLNPSTLRLLLQPRTDALHLYDCAGPYSRK